MNVRFVEKFLILASLSATKIFSHFKTMWPFQKLQALSKQRFNFETHRPVKYPQNSNSIIISTDKDESNAGIYTFDIDKNEMKLLRQFSSQWLMKRDHGQFIDYIHNDLYLFGGDGWQFCKFNFDEKTIIYGSDNHNYNEDIAEIGDYPKTAQISESIIYGARGNIHFIFDAKNQRFREIDVHKQINIASYYRKLTYIPCTKQLIIAGGDRSDNIYICNIDTNEYQYDYKWHKSRLKMPRKVYCERYYKIVPFGDILFVFYLHTIHFNNIWILDLIKQKWFISEYNVPKCFGRRTHLIRDKNDQDIHLLEFQDQLHFKVNGYELIPSTLILIRRKHYHSLIMGYIRHEEKQKNIPNIPSVLKQLILMFYPLILSTNI